MAISSLSILSNFANLFEILMYNRIYPSVRALISPQQQGFMGNRSTVTNLLPLAEVLAKCIDE